MKLVKWQFQSLVVPMVEINDNLYCTTKTICNALEMTKQNLYQFYRTNPEWFGEPLGCADSTLREFLKLHRNEFDIKRLKTDTVLWSDYQMFTFAKFSKSLKARVFHKELWDFVKQHAKSSYISVEQYNALEERMEFALHRIERLEQERDAASVPMNQIASGLGTLMNLQKKTKPFRTNKTIVGA